MSVRSRWAKAKIAIFGSSGVGKTAFAVRYITKRFIGEYDPNKEMLYTHKVMYDRDEIGVEILDTAAKGVDRETLEGHIRWADGFVLIYSVTDKNSHQNMRDLHAAVNSVRRNDEDTPMVLVANKTDLTYARKVTESEGAELIQELLCPLYEVSIADSPEAVLEAMDELLRQIKREYVKTPAVFEKKSGGTFTNVKRVLKKKIYRSRSDTM